jgi:hypothetical protein
MERPRKLEKGARFAFCEPVQAAPRSRWHIRELDGEPKFGGGASPPLCHERFGELSAKQRWPNGWDLDVGLTEDHLRSNQVCQKCVKLYREKL